MVRRFVESPLVLVCAIVAVGLLGLGAWFAFLNRDVGGVQMIKPRFTPTPEFNPEKSDFMATEWWKDPQQMRAARAMAESDEAFLQQYELVPHVRDYLIEHRNEWSVVSQSVQLSISDSPGEFVLTSRQSQQSQTVRVRYGDLDCKVRAEQISVGKDSFSVTTSVRNADGSVIVTAESSFSSGASLDDE